MLDLAAIFNERISVLTERTIGVIGGLGPAATLDFCSRIMALTDAQSDQDHLHVLVDNNPKTPNRNDALLRNGQSPEASLVQSALRLQAAGADFLVMPCNTAHAWAEPIRSACSVPLVHMVEEVVQFIGAQYPNVKKAGLLAADGCVKADLYPGLLEALDIQCLLFDVDSQNKLMATIYDIKSGKSINHTKPEVIRSVERHVDNGAEVIVAGCTEVPLVISQRDCSVPLIDSTEILAKACVRYAQNAAPLP